MFEWLKRMKRAPDDDLSPELKKIFDKIALLFESEAYQNSLLPPQMRDVILGGANCDKIPGGYGEFGREATNPIPVNGTLGQVLYLSQLRTQSGSPVMFHRAGSAPVGEITVDMYEVLSIDESVREYLYLSLYHPRKSRLCPRGYRIERKVDFGNPIYGVNFLVSNFPHALDLRIREWQMQLGVPLSLNEIRKYLHGNKFGIGALADKSIVWNGRKREPSDPSGLCFQCWHVKQNFMMPCEECGQRPARDDEAIYSIALSGLYYEPTSLAEMSKAIRSGRKAVSLSIDQMDALRPAAQGMLSRINTLFEKRGR